MSSGTASRSAAAAHRVPVARAFGPAVGLLAILVALVLPSSALAVNGQIKLALRPISQAGSYFALTMQAGQSRSLEVEIANAGDVAIAARTYASDVYTLVNGGFGARLRDESQTGSTKWLDYRTDVLQLAAGKGVQRTFTVAVPPDTAPGEYIASLIVENDKPLPGTGSVALNQVVRQAVAVQVTVPGPRSPGLGIGAASHKVVAGRSSVSVAVENTGNIGLKPLVTFGLKDSKGTVVSTASVQMDTFYAHTKTLVEVPLAALLLPGTYDVQLTLVDAAAGARAEADQVPLIVEAAAEPTAAGDPGSSLTQVLQGAANGQMSLALLGIVLLAGLLIGALVIGLLVLLMRRRRPPLSDK